MRNKKPFLFIGIGLAALIATACGGDDTPTPAPASTAMPTPTATPPPTPSGPQGTLNVADEMGSETLLQRTISRETPLAALGEPLLWWDYAADSPTVGAILESWDVERTADGKGMVWTLKAKPGIKFHQGYGEVTAEDIKFTMTEHLKEGSVNAWTKMVRQTIGEDADNVEVLDKYTLRINTPQLLPITEVFRSWSPNQRNTLRPFPKDYMQEVGEEGFIQNPVYSGPFEFVSQRRGEVLVMRAVPDHYRQVPEFEILRFLKVDDMGSRAALLKAGQLDVAPIPPRLAPEIEAAGLGIVTSVGGVEPFVNFAGMYPTRDSYDPSVPWNGENPLNENPTKVRQALNLAIDRAPIIDKIIGGYGRALELSFSFSGPGHAWWNPEWQQIPFDPERARELLAEAGYPGCFEMTMVLFNGSTFAPDVGEAVASMWEKHLNCTVKRLPADWRPNMRAMLVNRDVTIKNMVYAFDGQPIARPFRYACFHGGPEYQTVVHTELEFYTPLCGEAERALDTNELAEIEMRIGDLEKKYWATAPIASVDRPYAVNHSKVEEWNPPPKANILVFLEYAKRAR